MRILGPAGAVIFLFFICAILHCGKSTPAGIDVHNPLTNPTDGPPAGNPDGHEPIPADAGPGDVTKPDQVIGNGTPESCTAAAFIDAVAKGGIITFNGGTSPFTITLDRPAKVFNDAKQDIVIDGNGLVTLSGGSWYTLPGISMHPDTKQVISGSTIE